MCNLGVFSDAWFVGPAICNGGGCGGVQVDSLSSELVATKRDLTRLRRIGPGAVASTVASPRVAVRRGGSTSEDRRGSAAGGLGVSPRRRFDQAAPNPSEEPGAAL